MTKQNKIYLDYAATTPLDPKVLKAMEPYLLEKYGNPSSIHSFGQEAQRAIDKAREQAAKFLNCKSSEVVFTGSASESDNLAIKGMVNSLKRRKREGPSTSSPRPELGAKAGQAVHIITSQIEHKAILETYEALEKEGVKVTYLPVGRDGRVNLDDLKLEITPETDLVSIMYVNNETGAIQPIKKIGELIEDLNKNKEHKIYFHTDAVQAANWLDCDVQELKVDLLTLSAHKIYGPKGVGLLYIKQGTTISPLISGGSQEWGLRAGTENILGLAGFGQALELLTKNSSTKLGASNKEKTSEKVLALKNKLIKGVLSDVVDSKLNAGAKELEQAPHIANFSFRGVEGESLVMILDQEGIAVSTGSACTSKILAPSYVLMAMGLDDLEAQSSLRVSLGKQTTAKEIDSFLKVLPRAVERLRKISGR